MGVSGSGSGSATLGQSELSNYPSYKSVFPYLSFIVPTAGKELASGGQRAESKIRKDSAIPAEGVSVVEITVSRENGGNGQFVEHDDAVSGEFKEGQTFEDAAGAGRASVDNIPVHAGVSLRSTAHLLITPSDYSPATPQPAPSKRSSVCGSAAVVAGPSGAAQAIPVPAEIIQILETGMATLPPLSEGNNSSDPNLSDVKKKKICDSHVPYNAQEQNSLFVIQDHIKEGVGGSCPRKGFAMFFSTIIPNKGYFSTISDKNVSYIQIIFSRRKGCFKGAYVERLESHVKNINR